MTRLFLDRRDAGRRLADAVAALLAGDPGLGDPVVLALPRGGVPVALEIARRLRAPLDLVMVRKIGVPWQPELAAGAVVDGEAPQVVLNPGVVDATGLGEADLRAIEARELAEIARRRAVYLGGRAAVPVVDRAAIVVDDGVATGATMRAALRGVRARVPRTLVAAVPVGAEETIESLCEEVDRVICLAAPSDLYAIGAHYVDFDQVSDEEVVAMLSEARRFEEGEP